MRTLLTSAAIALLLAGGLTSCAEDEPRPKFGPATSATSEPTQEQTEEPETPEAFVERWIAALNGALEDGNVEEYLQMSQRCSACHESARRVSQVFDAGGSYEGGQWTVRSIRSVTEGDRTSVLARVDIAPAVRKVPGEAPANLDGGPARFNIAVGKKGGTWQVLRYSYTPGSN